MKLLSRCASLLLALTVVTVTAPRSVVGNGFNKTDPNSPVGYVIPTDMDAQAAPFVNEVAGDAASGAFTKPVSVSPTPTPTPTVAPTPEPTSNTTDDVVHLNASQHQGAHVQFAIRAGTTTSQAVNLGGWLVSEHWMNSASDIWKGLTSEQASAGEQTAFKNTDYDTAVSRFQWHRDHFITEDEIAAIAAAGLNTVRVPVGYWIVGFDKHDISGQQQWKNYAPGALEYLDRLVRDWAAKYNLAVLISMHAAKGSQNGADHSSPEQASKSFWSDYPENLASTLDAVVFLADRYKSDDAFLGIGLLNEPGGTTRNRELYQYYEDAYKAIRIDAQNDCVLTIAPLLWEQSANFMTDVLPNARNVWVEWHRYFVWGYEQATEDELLGKAMTQFRDDVEAWKRKSDKKMFIGEFSFATAGKFQDQSKLKAFGEKQMDVMRTVVNGGWAFWSWRIYGDENGVNPWSLRSLIRNGLFPGMAPAKQQ